MFKLVLRVSEVLSRVSHVVESGAYVFLRDASQIFQNRQVNC
jgi:hypothetical protein